MKGSVERASNLTGDLAREAGKVFDLVAEQAADAAAAARAYMATEEGRRFRQKLAAAVILGAPVLSELPVFRKTVVGRLLRRAAIATLLVKGAEWVRDWEPSADSLELPRT
jgi:hypothetical protein